MSQPNHRSGGRYLPRATWCNGIHVGWVGDNPHGGRPPTIWTDSPGTAQGPVAILRVIWLVDCSAYHAPIYSFKDADSIQLSGSLQSHKNVTKQHVMSLLGTI